MPAGFAEEIAARAARSRTRATGVAGLLPSCALELAPSCAEPESISRGRFGKWLAFPVVRHSLSQSNEAPIGSC